MRSSIFFSLAQDLAVGFGSFPFPSALVRYDYVPLGTDPPMTGIKDRNRMGEPVWPSGKALGW